MRMFARRRTTITNEQLRAAEARGAELAQHVVEDFGTTDVLEVAKRAGVHINFERWPLVTIGEYEPRTSTIRVNIAALERAHDAAPALTSEALARAIIAHELGHLFEARLSARWPHTSKAHLFNERVAHSFAACLLNMPLTEIFDWRFEISDLKLSIANQKSRCAHV